MSEEIRQELRLIYEEIIHLSNNTKRYRIYFQIMIGFLLFQAVISILILLKP